MTPTATFSEPMNAATITTSTVQLSGPGGAVPAGVSYDAPAGRAVLTPTGGLQDSTTYTMTVRGGAAGVADAAGNRLAADRTWSFTTAAATPPPDSGPGGPILVITKSSNPFTQYYAEILRAEGLNEFAVRDISSVSAATLAGYDVAILGDMTLTAAQVTMLSDWVGGGGNLIAMRPDPQLATLLGLSGGATTLANAYVKVDTSRAPGAGIVGDTMQYHGTADPLVAERGDERGHAVLGCVDGDDEPGGHAARRRHERRSGGRVRVRPGAFDRPDPAGQPGVGGT